MDTTELKYHTFHELQEQKHQFSQLSLLVAQCREMTVISGSYKSLVCPSFSSGLSKSGYKTRIYQRFHYVDRRLLLQHDSLPPIAGRIMYIINKVGFTQQGGPHASTQRK